MRNNYKHIVTFTAAILLSIVCFSQEQDPKNENQLALLYFSQGEYEKAADIYQNLFRQTHSQVHFDYLTECYNALQRSDKAESITKEQIKRYPQTYYYQVKLATIYAKTDRKKEANDIYEKIIKKAPKDIETCLEAAVACSDNKVDSVAKIILEQGMTKHTDYEGIIGKQLCKIYLHLGEYVKLADIYINLLKVNPYDTDFVEEQLQYSIYDKKNEQLRTILVSKFEKAVEKYRKNIGINEILLWILLQDKDFEKAFSLSKDIDIELDEDGEHVYQVGEVALENNDYTYAAKCFTYVVQKGPMGNQYIPAMKLLLETSYNKLFSSKTKPDIQQITVLEKEYFQALEDIEEPKTRAEIVKNLAHIQAFYLNKPTEATELLQNAISSPNLRSQKNILEMELADIYLFTNDIWQANLLYASIALNYKNNDIGHEAQLKQARIAYFNGNFAYAQALLDVLKGSTSKLIANDAFELAQLISDNTALDTSTTALEIFARGDLQLLQGNDNEAIACYDSIPKLFPGHSLEDEILMRKADIAKSQNDMEQMISCLQQIENRFSYEIYADKAIHSLAEYYDSIGDKVKAQEKYKKLIFEYPNSIYAASARNRYRELESQP